MRERSRCARMTESNAGREPHGRRYVTRSARRARHVPVPIALAQPSEHRIDLAHLEPRELLDVVARRRPVRREIRAHDARRDLLRVGQLLAPRDERRRLRVRPSANRRRTDERQRAIRECDRPAVVRLEHAIAEIEQLGARDRLVRHRFPERRQVDAQPRRSSALRLDVGRHDVRELGGAHHVQRRAKRARLEDRAVDEALRQRLLAKTRNARPERDVWRRRVLRLQRDELRHGGDDRHPLALEQHLPKEQRAVQLTE